MGTAYEADVIAWVNEQAVLLRSGNFTALDIEHIADEIEDVGKNEIREFSSRMAVLLSYLLKWQFQASYRSVSWEKTIKAQRKEIEYSLKVTPSLKNRLTDNDWIDVVWSKALAQAVSETGLDIFSEQCLWAKEQILSRDFFPEGG